MYVCIYMCVLIYITVAVLIHVFNLVNNAILILLVRCQK